MKTMTKNFALSALKAKQEAFDAKMESLQTEPKILETAEEIHQVISTGPNAVNESTALVLASKMAEELNRLFNNTNSIRCVGHYKNGIYWNAPKNMTKVHSEYRADIGQYRFFVKNGPVLLCFIAHTEDSTIELYSIEIEKDFRNAGLGTEIMTKILDYADDYGISVKVFPCAQKTYGYEDYVTKTMKLRQWYKDLDFVEGEGAWLIYSPF